MNTKWIFRLIGLAGVVLFILSLTNNIQMEPASAWMLGIGGSILIVFTLA